MRDLPLVQEILNQAAESRHLQESLIMGAVMEDRLDGPPWSPPSDGNWSSGPFRIKYWQPWREGWKGHPITQAQAEDPASAVAYAIKYEWDPGYQVMAGLNYRGNALRYANPIDVAYHSERPAHYYSAEQQARAHAAIQEVFGSVTIEKPPIRWFPAAAGNIRARPAGVRYEALVIHTTVGGNTIADLGNWFGGENLKQGVASSTHFGVDDPSEEAGQYVSLQSMAIAHGQDPDATAKLAQPPPVGNGLLTANAWAIGIELLDGGRPGNHTQRQLEKLARLAAWLWTTEIEPHAAVTGAVLDRDHILGHYELAPRTRTCPVWPEARFGWLINRMKQLLAGEEPVSDNNEKINDLYNEQVRLAVEIERLKAILAKAGALMTGEAA